MHGADEREGNIATSADANCISEFGDAENFYLKKIATTDLECAGGGVRCLIVCIRVGDCSLGFSASDEAPL